MARQGAGRKQDYIDPDIFAALRIAMRHCLCRRGNARKPPEIDRVIFLKEGKILADGQKSALLTNDHVSTLFESKMTLVQANGWYQVLPG